MSQFIDAGRPLTILTEEERMFFDSVKEFAQAEVKPLVSRMDHEAHLDEGLLKKLFEMGLMGIDIPEQYGGAGGTW